MDELSFLCTDANSGKLRINLIIFGWLWSKMGWFFACSYMVSAKLKVTLVIHMVKYGCGLLGPRTLKSTLSQLKDKSMNWAAFLHAESDAIIFG